MAERTPGQRIADLRKRRARERGKSLPQRELARAIGVERETVAAWETDRQTPRGQNLLKISRYFGVAPEYIVGDEVLDGRVAEPRTAYAPETAPSTREVDERIEEILAGADLSPHEKQSLMLDLAIVLRADAMRERDRAAVLRERVALLEAELAARRREDLAAAVDRGATPQERDDLDEGRPRRRGRAR